MPYYWSRVWEIYTASLVTDSNTPGTIINDLAWLFLEQGDTPESLYNDYNASNYREPCSDEQCDFKNWYDDIMSTGTYQGENLLAVLFQSCRTLTESEAITILHAAPCHVIIKFMNTMEEEFAPIEQDYLDYEIDTGRDGRQSPYNEQASNEPLEYYEETDDMPSLYGSSDEEDDDMPSLDGSSNDDMPSLDGSSDEEDDDMPSLDGSSEMPALDTNSAELVSSETWVESDYSTDYTTDDSTDYETDYESDYESHRQVSSVRV